MGGDRRWVGKAENRGIRRNPEWRDPDSNRGHHDFQSCGLGWLEARNPWTNRFSADGSSKQKPAIYELLHAVQEMEASHLLFSPHLLGVGLRLAARPFTRRGVEPTRLLLSLIHI